MKLSPFWLGVLVGVVSAVLGGVIEYLVAARREEEENGRLPGCLIMVTGGLGLAGVLAVGVSLFTGEMRRTLIMGAGVGAGFFSGFLTLAGIWLFLNRNR